MLEDILEAPQMVKLYDSEISLPGIYTGEIKAYVPAKTCTWKFIVVLFLIAKSENKPTINQ